ncbi:hypothetical protein [Asticcacaulis benevestitus]|uniref:Nudix hydrolase domain-containing protein n=1 Tax=Asticcacaulis benevestitus DSM 16100 = ATCC BAA-896 TaxID=1121022 RepID=V4PFR9_9CAUL|nr:hypothetical protein [Asticcacaulis benevestitus]ESQ92827.1 hypothetical protein ABENE_06915 [Asticcacaulis benevestitus DSM 16100 = ATCC BAA-896]
MDGLADPDAAAREAYEEAGLMGMIGKVSIGSFSYTRQPKGCDAVFEIRVEVYPIRIDRQLAFWPEASRRQTVLMSPTLAKTMISNPSAPEFQCPF